MMSPDQKQKHMKKVKISLQLHLFCMLHDLLFHSQYVYRVLLQFNLIFNLILIFNFNDFTICERKRW